MADAMRKLQRASGSKKAGDWHGDHDEYVRELAREMITRIPAWHQVTMAMQYGIDHEDEARDAYAAFIDKEVRQVGAVIHPRLDYLLASPDGIVGIDGGVELKVPLLSTHMDTLIDDKIPDQYLPQMYTVMAVCELEWLDFVSYCPPDPEDDERFCLPDEMRLFVKRLPADKDKFKEIEEAATATIEEAVALVNKLSVRLRVMA
jgi:YqaJ-like viral recombinase domain